jgi:hypothetical protein
VRLRPHDTDNFVFKEQTSYSLNMSRSLFFLALALVLVSPRILPAQDDGPPISITSPDAATTFAFGEIKNHALIWNKGQKMLIARVTFTDANQNLGQANDDTHEFRLPGVTFDPVKRIFSATTAKGEVIPVAHFKKVLFIESIETLPNAVVRVVHPKGVVTVILEAISPNDPALHPSPDNSDPDATHPVDIDKILN